MYISGCRIQNAAMSAVSSGTASDDYFYLVSLLLPGNGTNGAQNNTFLDSSTNNFTVTRNGNTTQGTFSPFSQTGWSGYFDGTGDYLSFTKNTTTGSFTCECWFYRGEDAAGGYHILFSGSNLGSVNPDNVQFQASNTGAVGMYMGGAVISATGTAVTKNQWNHIAYVRSGSSVAVFVNGSRISTGTSSAALNVISVGTSVSSYQPIGYISNARIVNAAVYDPASTSITVPTTPLTAIANTYLLTCQSNRFIDNSANAFALTVAGNTSVQSFAPFDPTAAYAASTVGGSGYFDGAGDYLDIAHNTNLTFPGDFTVEFWAYPTSGSGVREWYSKGYGFQLYSNGTSWYLALSANNSSSYFINASFGTLIADRWQHIVVTRSGNSYVGFVNGVATTLGTSASAPSTGTDVLRIGDWSGGSGYPVIGYISNVRFVQGTAVYGTSNFTPPTAPVSAISNTQLLLNYTNAGISDAAAKNALETVGSAQISTSRSKFGSSSIYLSSANDYLKIPRSELFAVYAGDFTVECWVNYAAVIFGYTMIFQTYDGTNELTLRTGDAGFGYVVQAVLGVGSGAVYTSSYTISDLQNVWTHLAFCRTGTTTRFFYNGVQQSSKTSSVSLGAPIAGYPSVGVSGYSPTAYIQDLRFTKGIGRYTTNFTPPTQAFPLL
jgi:hypothetical protein